MNTAIAFALGASLVAVTIAQPRVMIESTYTGNKGLNDLAESIENRYMGTTTDIKQLSDKYYAEELKNTRDFGMISPINSMNVGILNCIDSWSWSLTLNLCVL